ncbi:hypothetical protein CAPTEDRAFT_193507, partial [Capitella teleta]
TKDSRPPVILFSLVALEKFAQTSENKTLILKYLEAQQGKKKTRKIPLEILEGWRYNDDSVKRQVGFCSQWTLDNLFVLPNRQYSHEKVDMDGINVMLNSHDVSEYLKLSPNGLEGLCNYA